MHQRAWSVVGDYLTTNMRIFTARAGEAESTVLPMAANWIQEAFSEAPEVRSTEDHGILLWWNLPACGVISSSKYDYGITSISNLLAQFPRNGLAIVIHPNRASHATDRTLHVKYEMSIIMFINFLPSMKFDEIWTYFAYNLKLFTPCLQASWGSVPRKSTPNLKMMTMTMLLLLSKSRRRSRVRAMMMRMCLGKRMNLMFGTWNTSWRTFAFILEMSNFHHVQFAKQGSFHFTLRYTFFNPMANAWWLHFSKNITKERPLHAWAQSQSAGNYLCLQQGNLVLQKSPCMCLNSLL